MAHAGLPGSLDDGLIEQDALGKDGPFPNASLFFLPRPPARSPGWASGPGGANYPERVFRADRCGPVSENRTAPEQETVG